MRTSEASVPMVLKCEIGIAEGKPLMEQYGLDELAASADAVLCGLGPLAAGLGRLAVEASRAVTLDEMEGLVWERGLELLCGVVNRPGFCGGSQSSGECDDGSSTEVSGRAA